MPPVCPLTDKKIENEIIVFYGEDQVYLINKQIYLSISDFHECEFGDNVRIRLGMANEEEKPIPATNPTPLPSKPSKPNPPSKSFYDTATYTQPSYSLSLDQSIQIPSFPEESKQEVDVPIEGLIASVALALAIFQQAKQKKNEAESHKCCSESKIKLSDLDAKIQKLDAKIDEKTQKESKALHAEIYEQYKEIKDLKEDSEHVKEVLQQMIDFMKKKS